MKLLAAFAAILALAVPVSAKEEDSFAAALPEGVEVVWDLGRAFHEATSTRARVCLNGGRPLPFLPLVN